MMICWCGQGSKDWCGQGSKDDDDGYRGSDYHDDMLVWLGQ